MVKKKTQGAGTATRSEQIVQEIEEEIVSGRRPPGSRLNEREIADRFNVSRTPVREAVRHLTSAGLAEMHPRRGAFVKRIPIARLIQMFEAMTELEGICARLAARRMKPDEKEHLRRVHDSYERLADGSDIQRYYDESQEFHHLIFQGTQNPVLQEMAMRLSNQLTAYRKQQLSSAKRVQQSFAEHGKVLEAIMASDEDKAEELMRSHTHVVGDNVMDLIGSLSAEEVMA